MSSPSTANLVCAQFVVRVPSCVCTECVTNVADHGDESYQSYQSRLEKENLILLAQEEYGI